MQKGSIQKMSSKELLSHTKQLALKEKEIHAQILHYLAEIQSRKLHLKMGFSSLFEYVVQELGYSEGAAHRRIQTMKLCQSLPETAQRIQAGTLNLTTASQLQSFFEKKENKDRQLLKSSSPPALSQKQDVLSSSSRPNENIGFDLDEKKELLNNVEGCSTRETQRRLSEKEPELALPQEKVRFLGGKKVEVRVVLDERTLQQLEELKALLAHKNPSLSFGSLLGILSKEGLEKHNPLLKGVSSQPRHRGRGSHSSVKEKQAPIPHQPSTQTKAPAPMGSASSAQNLKENRYIPVNFRNFIWKRDLGQCTYKCHKTGRRCSSKHWLQIDHIQPLAFGGKTEVKNLRILCAQHNQARMALEKAGNSPLTGSQGP